MRGIPDIPVPAVFTAFTSARPSAAVAALCLSLWLAGCSSSTTVSEWSCPTDQPDGCFTVAEGDAMALAALRGAGTTDTGVTVRRTVVPADGSPSRVPLPVPISTGGEPDILYDADGWPVRADDGDETVMAGADAAAAHGRRDTRSGERVASGRGRDDSPLGGVSGDGGISPPDDESPVVDQGPVALTLFAEGTRAGTSNTPHADTSAPITSGPLTPGPMTSTPVTSERIIAAFFDASPSVSGPGAVRLPETLAEIWIGPFEDAAGNWHPAGRMFIIVSPARWRRP